jgi:hypothetical protein
MRKAMFLALALSAAAAAFAAAPRLAEAEDCYWYCDCETVRCSCGYYRLCPWPPPPIQCPTCP